MTLQTDGPPTWIVISRDISDAVDLDDVDAVVVSIIVDQETGLVRGTSLGATASQARVEAMIAALTRAVEPFTSTPAPRLVVCSVGEAAEVGADLATALEQAGAGPGVMPVEEAELPAEVSEILDELVDVLQRGMGPTDEPTPEDWGVLVEHTWKYAQAQPWLTWPDELQLRLVLTVEGEETSYVAAVIGAEGMQPGLVLYPGEDHSAVLVPDEDWEPEDPLPFHPGSLLLHLNPPDDTVEEMAAQALRHGWPSDAALMPVWLSAAPEGFADLEREEAVLFALALAGVMARDQQPLDSRASRITGKVDLPGGGEGHYVVTDLE
jgi:hypothetical protein